jgi:all-trans-nonaprenyl-diphosphate synthase
VQLIGAENPVLISAAEQIFGAGGKRLRPALVFLVSRATAQLAGLEYVSSLFITTGWVGVLKQLCNSKYWI